MEAKDLRIGNLFIEENSSEVIEVIELTKTKIWFTGDFPKGWQAKPIPLTEEWGLKMGDPESSLNFSFLIGSFKLWVDKSNPKDNKWWFVWNGQYIRVYFVHQLQNLYFALTNKELNIK